jgi:molecular chaperone GrpE
MARSNGKSDVEMQELDAERELPAAEGANEAEELESRAAASREKPGQISELEKLKAERDTLLDRIARMQADFDNARKRSVREQQDFRDYALADTLKSLLPVLDSFERALRSSTAEKSEFRSGVELIYKQLEDALAKLGLRPVAAKGEQFDPRFHEAIEMVDTTEAEDHKVLEELQHGYKLKDRLLRPAMVKVARNPGK